MSMSAKDPAKFLRVERAFKEGGEHRSNLQRFMEDHRAELEELFGGVRINWIYMTRKFTEMGFRGLDGSELKKETVRRMWWRVERTPPKQKGNRVKQIREVAEAAAQGQNDIFRAARPVTPASVQVVTHTPISAPPVSEGGAQAAEGKSGESGALVSSDEALARMLAEMDKRSGRG